MAGGFQYIPSTSFFASTPTAATAAAGYPVTEVTDWTSAHPVARSWHSIGIAGDAISFAFGGIRTGSWIAILNANFANIQIGIGDGAVFTDVVTGGPLVTRTLAADPADPEGYRKLFLVTPYTGTVGRLEIPAQAALDGAAYFRLGLVLWGSGLVTMTHFFHDPLVEDFVDPEYRVEGKDWEESYAAGIRSKMFTVRNIARNSEAGEWHVLRQLRPGTRLLAYMNQDNPTETYLCERNRSMTITRHGMHQEINTGLRVLA